MSPAQVVVRWIGWPSSIADASALSVGARWLGASVWAVLVVVLDEVIQKPFELSLIPEQGAIQEFVPDGANPSFSERIRTWRTRWGLDRVGADGGEHVVERSGVLAGAVTDHEPDCLPVGHREVAGGLVVQGPVGLVVMPAMWTRRVSISMKNRTWRRRRVMVSTQKKSEAIMAWAWLAMNWLQVGPVRLGVGSRPLSRRTFQTVEAAVRCPRRRSSPWMRR
jgi:hypothetical protein